MEAVLSAHCTILESVVVDGIPMHPRCPINSEHPLTPRLKPHDTAAWHRGNSCAFHQTMRERVHLV